MALEPLAKRGNYFHVYDFRVKPGAGERFIELFNAFDYSDANPMHKSPAQVKDGVLCRDVDDPDHFYLIGEWRDIEVHKTIRKEMVALAPEFISLVESGAFVPVYARIVSETPQDILDRAQGATGKTDQHPRHGRTGRAAAGGPSRARGKGGHG